MYLRRGKTRGLSAAKKRKKRKKRKRYTGGFLRSRVTFLVGRIIREECLIYTRIYTRIIWSYVGRFTRVRAYVFEKEAGSKMLEGWRK